MDGKLCSAPSATTAAQLVLQQQLRGQKGKTAPSPLQIKGRNSASQVRFLRLTSYFFTLHERKLGGGLLRVPSSATFAHVCFRTPSDCDVSSPKAAQPGSMRSKRPQSALTPAFLIRTKPKLLFAWIMYHVCVYAAVVPNVLFLYQITRGCKAQNP